MLSLPNCGPGIEFLKHTLLSSAVMTDEQKARLSTKRPLTKEEYEARQSVIRRVVDPETGRTRWDKVCRSRAVDISYIYNNVSTLLKFPFVVL